MALSDRHVEDAVERYLAAGDETRAARVVALEAEGAVERGELDRLRSWIMRFPAAVSLPALDLARGLLLATQDHARAIDLCRSAAERAREGGDLELAAAARIAAAGALHRIGRTAGAIELLTQTLAELEDGASHARGRALRLLGLARRDAGDIEAAVDAHTKAEYVFAVLGDPRAQARERCSLGRIHLDQGRLSEAQRAFVEVLDARGAGAELGQILEAQAGLVELRARRGDTDEAVDTLITPAASGEASRNLTTLEDQSFCPLWTMMHGPCVTVPAFTGPNSMPMGLQVVGPIGEDARLLEAARWIVGAFEPMPLRVG